MSASKCIRLEFDESMDLSCQACIAVGGSRRCIENCDRWFQTPGNAYTIGDLSEVISNDCGLAFPINLFSGEYLLLRSMSIKILDLTIKAVRVVPRRNCAPLVPAPVTWQEVEVPRFLPPYLSTPVHPNNNGVDNCSLLISSGDDSSNDCGKIYLFQSKSPYYPDEDELLLKDVNTVNHDNDIACSGEDFEEVNQPVVDISSDPESAVEMTALENPQYGPILSLTEQTLASNLTGPVPDSGQSSYEIKMNVYSSCRKRKRENTLSLSESESSQEPPSKQQITVDQSALVPIEDQSSASITGSSSHDIDSYIIYTKTSDDSLSEQSASIIKTEISSLKRKISFMNSDLLSTSCSSEEIVTPPKIRKAEEGEELCTIGTPTPNLRLVSNRFGPFSGIQRFQLDQVSGEGGVWLPVASLNPLDVRKLSRLKFEYQVPGPGHEIISVPLVGELMWMDDTRIEVKVLSEDGRSTGSNSGVQIRRLYEKSRLAKVEVWSNALASSPSDGTSEMHSKYSI